MTSFRTGAIAALLLAASAPGLAQTPAARPAPAAETRIMSPVLRSGDIVRSLKFYTSALGMVERGRVELKDVTEVILGFADGGGAPGIILIVPKGAEAAGPVVAGNGYIRTVLRVRSVKAAVDRITAAGFVPERTGSHGAYKIAMVRDPDGYLYELVEFPGEGN